MSSFIIAAHTGMKCIYLIDIDSVTYKPDFTPSKNEEKTSRAELTTLLSIYLYLSIFLSIYLSLSLSLYI